MSTPSTTPDVLSAAADVAPADRIRSLLGTARDHVIEPVRVIGFWSAIALPFMYVPLLATGIDTAPEAAVFFGLLAANLVAIAVGHSYDPS